MRITRHPILEFERDKEVTFIFEGRPIKAFRGESIAAALHANGVRILSHGIRTSRPRGFFCGIGKCSSCLMRVNGVPNVRTCITEAEEGMVVERQDNRGDMPEDESFKSDKYLLTTEVLIIGGGPAGLSAALTVADNGGRCVLVEDNPRLGGQLIKQTHRFFGSSDQNAGVRGIRIAEHLVGRLGEHIEAGRVMALTDTRAIGYYRELEDESKHSVWHRVVAVSGSGEKVYEILARKLIVATGARENMITFPNNDLPGIYGAGGVQTLMNVYGIHPGNRVLMVGAGNVGLIVSYQLIQSGIEVAALVEAMPHIGGYHVHAAKLRRMGVPIYVGHTVKEAYGKDRVEGAIIAKVDKDWNIVPGTEMDIKCDVICLAVGLTPSVELLFQAGCQIKYIPHLGGHVPIHDMYLETSVDGIYVAGDASGIEEASVAIMEGAIAGAHAALRLRIGHSDKLESIINGNLSALEEERASRFGERIREGKRIVYEECTRTGGSL